MATVATKEMVITDKNAGVEGLVTLTGENEVTISWADERDDVLSVDEFKALSESDDYDIEEREFEELDEETDAQASIETHATADRENGGQGGQGDGNPKTRWDYITGILGSLAQTDTESLAQWFDQVQGQGNFGGVNQGKSVVNKSSIDMKPSNAEGSTDNNSAPYMPGLGENVLVKLQKEEQDAIFGETEITEEAKTKMTTLFEAAVTLRLTEEAVKLQAIYEAKLEEQFETASEKIVEGLDQYLSHCVEEFMIENQVAIESTLRAELVHDFIDGLKGLFTEHYIDIPEDQVNVVEALSEENDSLKEKLNEATNKEIETKNKINELQKSVTLASLSEGLTLPQKDKLRKATADIVFETESVFVDKVKVIKEGFINEKTSNSNILLEGIDVLGEDKPLETSNSAISALARVVSQKLS